ncbi:radical S-adenosyl methionine domain-containing protein 1, mitochondrial isoform X3 [Acomys russatus]|uniref:radical S-adenosyl methionine domain-containing protein 1, mitochondrial isoform X3 n=1 Tax=Acomys russatus TaxID=60746 RepID=UPI0021E26C64|nr:radical S-adenosyl methionine domain-containing protein 1, mitochondrial isoform X3 [Acomys russatus]
MAPQTRGPGLSSRAGRGNMRSRSPSDFRRGGPRGPARAHLYCTRRRGFGSLLSAALRAMGLSRVRTSTWVAAARAAQRRPRVDNRGQPRSPEPASTRAALYVHWPYCEKRCSYCNFNKYIPRGVEEGAVRNCLVTEARTLLRLSGVRRVESVFFGGGTPSLASPHTLAAVLEAVAQEVHLPADSEVTLEANPTSAPGPKLAAFGAAGVNRLSIGLQVQQGTLPAPDQDLAAEMYQEGRTVLRDAGFRQYEVSNFARNGALSTHNWTYWQCGQYLGVGPGAHGQFVPQGAGSHTREARIQTLEPDNWMKEVMLFGHGTRKCVPLGKLELLEEVLAMGLRTDVGVTHQHWQQFEPQLTLWDVFGAGREVKELLARGLLLLDHRGLRCSWEGLAVLDSLLLTLLPQLQEAWQHRTPSPVTGG